MVSVRLPDGSQRQFDNPVTVAQVAANIGTGLAKAALAGRVDGKLVDTSYLIDKDADLAIITRHPEPSRTYRSYTSSHCPSTSIIGGTRSVMPL